MKGDIDSLNASVAGVLAYEIVRQRMELGKTENENGSGGK